MFGYAAGSAIALVARRPLARTFDPVHTRYFAATALWGGLVFAPCGLTFYALYPDWSLMYLANPAHLSPLLVIPFLIALYIGAPLAGFLVSHRLVLNQRTRALRSNMLIAIALLAAIVIFGGERLFTVAYYDAFHAGARTLSLFQSRLRVALPLASAAVVMSLAYALVRIRDHVQRCENVPGALPEERDRAISGPDVSLPSVAPDAESREASSSVAGSSPHESTG